MPGDVCSMAQAYYAGSFVLGSTLSPAVVLPGDQASVFSICPVSEAATWCSFRNPCDAFGLLEVTAFVHVNWVGSEKVPSTPSVLFPLVLLNSCPVHRWKMLKIEVLKAGLLFWCWQACWKLRHTVYFKKCCVFKISLMSSWPSTEELLFCTKRRPSFGYATLSVCCHPLYRPNSPNNRQLRISELLLPFVMKRTPTVKRTPAVKLVRRRTWDSIWGTNCFLVTSSSAEILFSLFHHSPGKTININK